MNYVARLPDGSVNVSRRSPLADFFLLSAGLAGLLVGLYMVLGAAADTLVTRLPVSLEYKAGRALAPYIAAKTGAGAADTGLYALFDSLRSRMPDTAPELRLHVADIPAVNAVALPGGHIVVFRGLLDSVHSREQLAFVLAHELGHFHNRDHVKGIGRSLVLMIISSAVLGPDNALSSAAAGTILGAHRKYSQRQELAADLFGLELTHRTLGSVDGATGFFERFRDESNAESFKYFFSTHPDPAGRARVLREHAQIRGYTTEL